MYIVHRCVLIHSCCIVMDEILSGVKAAPTTDAALPAAEQQTTGESEGVADEMAARLAKLKA